MSRFVIRSGRNTLTLNAHGNHKGCLMIEVSGGGFAILLDAEQLDELADEVRSCAEEVRRIAP